VVAEGFAVTRGQDELTAFEVSENSTRSFCRVCGTHVFSANRRYRQVVGVPLGVAVDLQVRPRVHAFFDTAVPWCDLDPSANRRLGS
jgi:hypothetical protein